jgi:hypothetical protein
MAEELPTIDSEFPPALRITSKAWNVKLERVGVAIQAAPDVTFVTLALTGREQEIQLDIDVPSGTKAVGLGFEGESRSAWGRPMPRANAVDRHRGGALLVRDDESADQEHLTLHVTVPSTVELALRLPPLPRLAIETSASVLVVEVAGEKVANKQRRVVVELEDVAGSAGELEMPSVTERISLVASPAALTDFFEATEHRHMRGSRDLDKAMIRRRMKWFRPGLRECFMREAQWGNSVRRGGAVLSFMIAASGVVEWATTSESDLPASVNTCLVDQLMRWEFPAADGKVQVNYPVTFGLYGE